VRARFVNLRIHLRDNLAALLAYEDETTGFGARYLDFL
jgi:hypothetical protein